MCVSGATVIFFTVIFGARVGKVRGRVAVIETFDVLGHREPGVTLLVRDGQVRGQAVAGALGEVLRIQLIGDGVSQNCPSYDFETCNMSALGGEEINPRDVVSSQVKPS